ncbi:unnamed protein product [Orchesella dallaii]|uniref:Large ribosomal subunit protein uL30 N-terminal eukaryotes domain-containing protein n=1 Tax=Orchesella dallaii TaxID=48710 RepID=A0ABP1S631_9HEXA
MSDSKKAAAAAKGPKPTGKKLPAVPESILKRRKKHEVSQQLKLKQAVKQRSLQRNRRVKIFKRAEKYVKEYRAKERDEIRLARQARTKGNYYVPAEAKLAFVIRIRG